MISKEPEIQKTLHRQKTKLSKSNCFTPFLKWAPNEHVTFKRQNSNKHIQKTERNINSGSDLQITKFDIEKAEKEIYESIIKQQIDKGRNMVKQFRTVSISRISEKSEEDECIETFDTAKSTAKEYKKDSATTASSSSGKKTTKRLLKESAGMEDLIKAYKESEIINSN